MSKGITAEIFRKALEKREKRDELCVLIVEDQKFSRLLMKNALLKHYEVHTAATGEEALAIYVEHAPDIVFLDIELPGVDGHKVLELITKLDKKSYVVMVTANHYPKDVQQAMEHGARGFVVKPYQKDTIFGWITKYLEQQQQSEGGKR